MNRTTLRRRVVAGALGLAAAASVAACMPADNASQSITLAGSDTTQDVMDALAEDMNGDTAYNTDPDTVYNILSQQPSALVVGGDGACATKTYRTPAGAGQTLAPNGSSAGRDALKASVLAGDGCIDIARSSSGPRAIGSDLATFKYVAFGLDAVGWSSASSRAPANLTLAQLRGIYDCTFTDWSQVGGSAGPIQRYYPQAGSGTRSFFESDVLGFNPTTITATGCPAPILIQENSGMELNSTMRPRGIMPYSAANFTAQTRGTQPDQRNSQVLRRLDNQALVTGTGANMTLNTAGPVRESNVKLNDPTPDYPGIRYVFNVFDSTSASYAQANRLFGFINESPGGKSPLCNGAKASTIANYGFGPLDTTTSDHNLNGSTCRLFVLV